jgi:hypothetical protein
MDNIIMQVDNIVGISRDYMPSPYFSDAAWTKVGQFDEWDGTDSDTRMGRRINGGGPYISFFTYEGSSAEIQYVAPTYDEILQIVPGKKYVVKYYISGWVVDYEEWNGTMAQVILGSASNSTNNVMSVNRSGEIEGIVTASENEIRIRGFSDYYGSWSMKYLSIKEYDEDRVYNTIDLDSDLSFPITYQVDDLSTPDKRQTSYSKTITVPGTKNNNVIFKHIFDIENESDFNPNKALKVTVLSDSFTIFKGSLRLISIEKTDKEMYEYNVELYSNVTDIFGLIGDSELQDLDFSEYNHTYNAVSQVNSWGPEYVGGDCIIKFGQGYQNFYTSGPNYPKPKGEGYVYCLLYNGKVNMLDYALPGRVTLPGPCARVEDIFPGIYVREYLSKIFRRIGKTWTSSLFDSIPFRKLVIPYNDTTLKLTTAQINSRLFKALSNSKYKLINFGLTNAGISVIDTVNYSNDSTGGAFDNSGSFYTAGDGVWYAVKGGTYNFDVTINLAWRYFGLKNIDGTAPDGSNPVRVNFQGSHRVAIVKIGVGGDQSVLAETTIDMPNDTNSITSSTGQSSNYSKEVSATNIDLRQGDQVYVVLDANHTLQTNNNNDENGRPVTPQGLFYQFMPPLQTVIGVRTNPPLTNNEGDKYLISSPASGAWAGKEGQIATKLPGLFTGWSYFDPPIYTQVLITGGSPNIYWIRTGTGYTYGYSDSNYYTYLPTYWRPGTPVLITGYNGSYNWDSYTEDQRNIDGGYAELIMNPTVNYFQNGVVNTSIADGDTIDINSVVPDNIKQLDFLKSILKMYNCFMVDDPNDPNNIIIEPRDDFYTNDYIDTWKFDLEFPILQTPLSELDAKKYIFTHKDDGDYINAGFKANYGSGKYNFGSFVADYDNDFLQGEKKIETIFSPMPVWRTYPQKAALASSVKEDSNYSPFKGNIKILYYNGRETREPGFQHIYDAGVNITARYIPSLNMWDDMYNPQNSLCWGNSGTSYYWTSPDGVNTLQMTNNTLYNKYYSKYMRDISSRNSKLITAYVKLNMVDINELDFSKLYYIDGHWLRLMKVIDYNPFSNGSTKCEFLKYLEGRSFTGTYPIGPVLNGGLGFGGGVLSYTNSNTWAINGELNLTRLGEDTIRAEDISSNGGSYVSHQRAQTAIGTNNYVAATAERINIVGDGNRVLDYASRISIMNSDNVVIESGLTNVVVHNTSDITVKESNVSYISGVKVQNGEIIESVDGIYSVIDGGEDQLQNPFSDYLIDQVDGGLDALRNYGSDSTINTIEGGIDL